jgi:hypothetical protein
VDGGVQVSKFAYGDFVAVGRACALINSTDRTLEKKVKMYVGQVYDDRDKNLITSYVRTICEYEAAYGAAVRVLKNGGQPIVFMDGSLYFSRLPYSPSEYGHHSSLISELLDSITKLRNLAKEEKFILASVAKDSSVFYLYMELLKSALKKAGLGRLLEGLEGSSSPFDLMIRSKILEESDRLALKPFIEDHPMCDPVLVQYSTDIEGYTVPLYLASTIFNSSNNRIVSLMRNLENQIGSEESSKIRASIQAFFKSPGVASLYWKPTPKGRPFRVDVLASCIGRDEAWETHTRNLFIEGYDRENVQKVLNHLSYWFCNEVEYNVPLKQADTLARFDRNLYKRKYEPFIVRELEEAGLDVTGTRRELREIS